MLPCYLGYRHEHGAFLLSALPSFSFGTSNPETEKKHINYRFKAKQVLEKAIVALHKNVFW